MNQELRKDAKQIIDEAIASVQPDAAVRRALSNIVFSEHVYIVAIGKAGWQMANAAVSYLQENGIKYENGIVITKYHHCLLYTSHPLRADGRSSFVPVQKPDRHVYMWRQKD